MKLRRLIRYEAGTRATNPGAAGSPSMPCINTTEVLQYKEDGEWEDVPVVHDRKSLEKAQRDKYRGR